MSADGVFAEDLEPWMVARVDQNIAAASAWIAEMVAAIVDHLDPDDPCPPGCVGEDVAEAVAALDHDSAQMALLSLLEREARRAVGGAA